MVEQAIFGSRNSQSGFLDWCFQSSWTGWLFWRIFSFLLGDVGPSVTSAALSFLNYGRLLKEINYTHIALIPKVPSPQSPGDFRPINLCNVIYKIISKSLANRVKHILLHYISQSQNAFVLGRLISDSPLLACEFSILIAHTKEGNKFTAALKLDMSKAFDRVS